MEQQRHVLITLLNKHAPTVLPSRYTSRIAPAPHTAAPLLHPADSPSAEQSTHTPPRTSGIASHETHGHATVCHVDTGRHLEKERDFLADMLARAGGGKAEGVKREVKGLVHQLVASYEQIANLR